MRDPTLSILLLPYYFLSLHLNARKYNEDEIMSLNKLII